MPTPTNIHNPPALMDVQDPDPLANSLVLDFLVRNSFNDIASEFKKMSGTDIKILHSGLKLEDLVSNLFVKSIVYDFLRRTAHAKIAFEFKHLYGPFQNLNELTLEKLYVTYKEKFNVIPTNSISSSQSLVKSKKKVNSTKPENIPVPSTSHAVIKSNKEVNSLVYNFLVRKYHFDVASEFKELVRSLEDVQGGPLLEDMFTHYMLSMKSNVKVIIDKEQYLKIVKLNDEYHDHIQNFQPKVDSQLDQVVLFLILQNLETHTLSIKLLWSQLIHKHTQRNYPWITVRHFSICQGGEKEMMMKNYEELISNARVNNPTKICNEILENLKTKQGKPMSENEKWKLIMVGVFLSKGLSKVRHAFDVLIRVMNDVKSQSLVKGEYSIEEDKIISETVQKYGNNMETWEKLSLELNRPEAYLIRQRYERLLTNNIFKAPNHRWSIEEDKILIDCLFKDTSMKNPNNFSSILLKNIKDSKANEKINRSIGAITKPLLLQYHQGTVNTPWKYSVLQYIYEKKLESPTELGNHMAEINKSFPWLNINLVSMCCPNDVKKPLHEMAKNAMNTYKDRPAHSEKALKRCEETIEYYDPKGELSEYKLCKIHEKCLKSHGCGSL